MPLLPAPHRLLFALLVTAAVAANFPAAARPTYVVKLSTLFGIPITVGSHAVAYQQTADTGSGIVNFPCSASCASDYNPLKSSSFVQPTAAECLSVENGNAMCDWNYTYHPSNQNISGNIIQDQLSLSTASPPLSFPALMGCIQQDTSKTSCPGQGVFGGMDRGNSSIISQLAKLRMVADTVGFCAPILPMPSGNAQNNNSTTYLLLGSARPKGAGSVKRSDFLSPTELAAVAAANGWAPDITARMSLRYIAVFASVSFANYSFSHNMTAGTANMDTGGGPVISMPADVTQAYFAATAAAAARLNLTLNSKNCVASPTGKAINLTLAQTAYPAITFVFRGRDKAKAVVPSQALTLESGSKELCSVISVEPSSIPTAYWPSQPLFRGRYAGFDRRRNALLLSGPTSCVDVTV